MAYRVRENRPTTNSNIGIINLPQQWKQLERSPSALTVFWRHMVHEPERCYRDLDTITAFRTFKSALLLYWRYMVPETDKNAAIENKTDTMTSS